MLTPVIENIIVKYLNKEASSSELETLDFWLKDEAHLEIFKSYIKTNHLIDANVLKFDTDTSKKQLFALISKEKKVIRLKTFYRVVSYAAVLLVMLGIGYLFKDQLFVTNGEESNPQTNMVKSTIEIGTDKATLTLEDGSKVELNKGSSYQSAFAESDGEALVYQDEKGQSVELAYNYLTIPRGGQFFVQLSDGTKVWLNSETQLKYPKNFIDGKPREVELVYGEAYFEVSPSTLHNGDAFTVKSQMQTVEVLGTQFNIKAYKDESDIYTTLVEGKVMVNGAHDNTVLKPGQQSINSPNSSMVVVNADVNLETAWRQGLFSFKEKSLKDIMIVLSRWYDVDIAFANKDLEKIRFKGVLSKEQELEDILSTIKNLKAINAYEITKDAILIK